MSLEFKYAQGKWTLVTVYIGKTKRVLTLRLREHQANCRNQKQHSAVVDHSAIGHSWGFNRAKIVNTQRNTIKRKIAESLFISRVTENSVSTI